MVKQYLLMLQEFPYSLNHYFQVSRASELSTIESYEVGPGIGSWWYDTRCRKYHTSWNKSQKVKGFDRIGCSVVYDEIRRYLQSVNVNDSDAYIDHLIGNRSDANALKITDSLWTETFGSCEYRLRNCRIWSLKQQCYD